MNNLVLESGIDLHRQHDKQSKRCINPRLPRANPARKFGKILLILLGLYSVLASQQAFSEEETTANTVIFSDMDALEQSASDSFLEYMRSSKLSAAKSRKIKTANGIDVIESVHINGLEQSLMIRGKDKSNPVLLYLHGGPGAVTMPMAYAMSPRWEEEFVMVHWDQRGTGKTRCANPDYDPRTASFKDFYKDTVEVVNYLRERLGKDKIIVLGHSWGTLIGTHLAKNKPELLYAYVGTGQMTNTIESETLGYEFVLTEARNRKDEKGIELLESIAPYPPAEKVTRDELQRKISTQRKYLQKYGGALQFSYMDKIYRAFFESPDYSICDWMGYIDTHLGGKPYPHRELTGLFLQKEAGIANFDQDLGFDFTVPIFFFLGALDYQTSTIVATRYFEKIRAPRKKLVIFENSGHAPSFVEEEEFISALVNHVRPLALEP